MSTPFLRVSIDNQSRWALDSSFRHVADWQKNAHSMSVRLAVGPTLDPRAYKWRGSAAILSKGAFDECFLLDTGAADTLISGGVAQRLHLPLKAVTRRVIAGDQVKWVYESELAVCIGGDWIALPCCIPHPFDPFERVTQLLGMKGIIDRYLVCFSADGVQIFQKRHSRPHEGEKDIGDSFATMALFGPRSITSLSGYLS